MTNTIPHYEYTKQGSTVRDDYTTRPNLNDVNSLGREQHNKNKVHRKTSTSSTKKQNIVKTTTFKYPEAWKNKMPKFPFVPKDEEVSSHRPTQPSYDPWKDGNMPIFPANLPD